jgi:type IV pilus assembly protein PilQ
MRFSPIKKFFCVLCILFISTGFACAAIPAKATALDFENIESAEVLRILAKFLDLNLIISPAVTGTVSLHLHDTQAQDAFKILLQSQGLSANRIGNVYFIAPFSEMIKRKEDDLRLKDATSAAALLVTHTWQIRYAKADDIAHLIQDANASLLSRRGHVRVDARTNMLCVQDLAENLAQIEALVKKLDIAVQQVCIEARLVSVDNDYERELGIDFSVHPATSGMGLAPVVEGAVLHQFSLAVATLADGSLLDIALAAMENEGHGELLSRPSLFTANQQTAVIESGEEIPYQEVSLSGGTGVAFKKAVLSLKVTPQIMPGHKVLLQLNINQDRPSNRMVLGVPAITTRQITTNVLVRNGQTLVLGGIYELNKELDEQRIPFLGKIPVVGLLFQQQNIKENKRELLIFVTPKIIS